MTSAAMVMAAASHQRRKNKKKHLSGREEANGRQAETKTKEMAGPSNWYERVLDVLNSLTLQTLLYLAFVFIFQNLANTLRLKEEYYMDKHVMDRFVQNHFDSSHNTFESVRRIADIYEWGNNVLWPGFFADMGPCNEVRPHLREGRTRAGEEATRPARE